MADAQEVLLGALRKAISQNEHDRHLATQTIQTYSTEPQFHEALVTVLTNVQVFELPNGRDMRILAATLLKNGVDKFWRKSAPKSVILLIATSCEWGHLPQ